MAFSSEVNGNAEMYSLLTLFILGVASVGKPRAAIEVVANGCVSPELVRLRVIELRETAALLLKSQCPDLAGMDGDIISIDIKRTARSDDEHASIHASITVSVAVGAFAAMN